MNIKTTPKDKLNIMVTYGIISSSHSHLQEI
jgi:hypothetical protein